MATESQKSFILALLAENGLGTAVFTRRHLPLAGGVEGWVGKPIDAWLEWLDNGSASVLIDELKQMKEEA